MNKTYETAWVYVIHSDDIGADAFDVAHTFSLADARDLIRRVISNLTDSEAKKTDNYITGHQIPVEAGQTAKDAYYCWLDSHVSDPDYVESYSTSIRLVEDAHIASSHRRIPTAQGEPSAYAMEGSWYEAKATDNSGAEYLAIWEIRDTYNPAEDDKSDACDWDNPYYIIRNDPWMDVTDIIRSIKL